MNVDLSRSIEVTFRKTLERADCLRQSGQGAAAAVYREAARLSRQLAQYAVGPAEKTRRLQRASDLETLAEKVMEQRLRAETPRGAAVESEDELQAQIDALVARSDVTWADIGGLEATKRQIQIAFGIAVARKPAGVLIDPVSQVLLYGPPGTGKSLLAAAVSNGLQATFFNVSAANVLSKWFGESSRLISRLFATARRRAPSVVFIDELEALFPSRDAETSGAERRVLSTLLAELSGLQTSRTAATVFTIGATNAPWLMDSAALSRFGRRVHVPLPDADARRAILDIHLVRKGHTLDFPLGRLVQATDGLSGRQLAHVAAVAVETMVARCNPNLADIVAGNGPALETYQITTRSLVWSDLKTVLAHIKPDSNTETIERLQTW